MTTEGEKVIEHKKISPESGKEIPPENLEQVLEMQDKQAEKEINGLKQEGKKLENILERSGAENEDVEEFEKGEREIEKKAKEEETTYEDSVAEIKKEGEGERELKIDEKTWREIPLKRLEELYAQAVKGEAFEVFPKGFEKMREIYWERRKEEEKGKEEKRGGDKLEKIGEETKKKGEREEKSEAEKKGTGEIIQEFMPISSELAEEINKSEWADYPTIIKKEQELAKKYNISDLAELSPFIIKGVKEDPNLENKLAESIEINLKKLPLVPFKPGVEAKNIAKNFLQGGEIKMDTLENTTALYNALLKDAKIFKTEGGNYKTLKDFAEKEYFGKSVDIPEIKCISGQEHDAYSKKYGESLGLKGEKLEKFIDSRKNIQAYTVIEEVAINKQSIERRRKILFNQRSDLNLGVVISTALHEFGHDVVDKLLGSKKISPDISPTDTVGLKSIEEGVPEDFAQYTLERLNEIYRDSGFDLLAINRQASSLEAKDIPHKYGSSIVHALRESSPEEFKTEVVPKLLKVISGETKLKEVK